MSKKTFKIISLSFFFLILLLFGLFLIIRFGEIQENYFLNIDVAKKSGAIDAGWMPEVLPKSSTDIYERHDLDTNTVWLKFKFDRRDINELITQIKEMTPVEIEGMEFPKIRVKWWPKNFSKDSFTQSSLKIYRYDRKIEYSDKQVKTVPSFFVIDWNSNTAYYWQY